MSTVAARDLCPGDVIALDDYPCDVLDVYHDGSTHMTVVRWSVCPKDVIWLSSNTPVDVLGRLDD
jgi:hypothetical protein